MFEEGIEDIKNKIAWPQREYAAPDMRPYANFSKNGCIFLYPLSYGTI